MTSTRYFPSKHLQRLGCYRLVLRLFGGCIALITNEEDGHRTMDVCGRKLAHHPHLHMLVMEVVAPLSSQKGSLPSDSSG